MTESEAWTVLNRFAVQGRVQISPTMSVNALRRALAKVFQPRQVGDDDTAMRQINPAIDVISEQRDLRELRGQAEPNPATFAAGFSSGPASGATAAPPAPAGCPWQTDPWEGCTIYRDDATDPNYVKKMVYERSVRFGTPELVRAWAWDGWRFRKVIAAYANEYAYEDLGRALLILGQAEGFIQYDAVFITKGTGRVHKFRLIIARVGRSYEHASSYDFTFDCEPDNPRLGELLRAWLNVVTTQLKVDRSYRR